MSLSDIRAGLGSALETTGVDRVYPEDIDKVEPPALVIGNPDLDYDFEFGGGVVYLFPVTLLVGRQAGVDVAVRVLDEFLDPSSPTSVHAAIAADAKLDGTCASAGVKHAAWGQVTWAGTEFVGITFDVEVIT